MAAKAKLAGPRHYKNITTEMNGRGYSGSFYLEGGSVHVGSAYGSKSAPLNAAAPYALAHILLDQIVTEAARRNGQAPASRRLAGR